MPCATRRRFKSLIHNGFSPLTVYPLQRIAKAFAIEAEIRSQHKRDFTKHMIRLRHVNQINDAEANEVILLNSHDGTSSYQTLAGMFRFVCANGLVFGETVGDVRVRHKGEIVDNVIEGAFQVLDGFELVREQREEMRAITLDQGESEVFARAALALKYEPNPTKPAPITEAHASRTSYGEWSFELNLPGKNACERSAPFLSSQPCEH